MITSTPPNEYPWDTYKVKVVMKEITVSDRLIEYLKIHASFLSNSSEPSNNYALLASKSGPTKTVRVLEKGNTSKYVREVVEDGIIACTICYKIGHLAEEHKWTLKSSNNEKTSAPGPTGTSATKFTEPSRKHHAAAVVSENLTNPTISNPISALHSLFN